MAKTAKSDEISKRHDTDIWVEIRRMYESKSRPTVEKIVEVLKAEFDIDKFPSVRTIHRHAKNENWKRQEDSKKDPLAKGYDDDIWECIKSVFESNPKLSFRALRDKVQNELQCDNFPSHNAVKARAKKEDWKNSEALLHKDDRALKKIITEANKLKKLTDSSDEDYEIYHKNQSDGVVEDEEYQHAMSVAKVQISQIQKLIVGGAKKKESLAEVILRGRQSMRTISLIEDMISDRLVEYHTVLTSQEFLEICPYELYKKIKSEQKETMLLSKAISEASFSRRENIKFQLSLHGVLPEDLRDRDEKTIVGNMNDDSAYEEQRRRLAEQREELLRKRRYIDSGQMEKDVERQVAETLKNMDDEFVDVDAEEHENAE